MPLEEGFREGFRPFELRAGFLRPEAAQSRGREGIGNARHQRRLGADDRQRGLLALRELQQSADVVGRDRDVAHFRLNFGAGVAGGNQYFAHTRRVRTGRQASACSRPPPPTINTFIAGSRPCGLNGGNDACR